MDIGTELDRNNHIAESPASVALVEKMHNYVAGRAISAAIYVAAKLGIADKIHHSSLSYEHLAQDLQVDPQALYRLLRALAGEGIFEEQAEGKFALTELGSLLQSNIPNSLRDLVIMCGDPWHWTMWGGLLYTVQTGKPYFEEHFGMDFFSYIQTNPNIALGFNAAMSSLSSLSNFAISEMIDFEKAKLLVDVGGGEGGLLLAILQKYPQLQGVLYDLPATIKSAEKFLSKYEIHNRCTLLAGDFFISVPQGGDVYVVKHVFHGLDDNQCLSILQHIKTSGNPQLRLIIVEMLIPEANTSSYSKFNDLEMMLISKRGKERTQQQLVNILRAAGFTLVNTQPICMGLSVIEAQLISDPSLS